MLRLVDFVIQQKFDECSWWHVLRIGGKKNYDKANLASIEKSDLEKLRTFNFWDEKLYARKVTDNQMFIISYFRDELMIVIDKINDNVSANAELVHQVSPPLDAYKYKWFSPDYNTKTGKFEDIEMMSSM